MKKQTFLHALLLVAAVVAAGCGGDDGGSGGAPDARVSFDAAQPDAASLSDAAPPDAVPPDAAIPVMSITEIIPQAASRTVTTEVTVLGANLATGATLTLSNCDTATEYDLSASVAVAGDGLSLTASLVMDLTREQGLYTVAVMNPDGQADELSCVFRVLAATPPTVTEVVPTTAYRGVPGDGVSSDATITLRGTGFAPTPRVRWVKADGSVSYDALFVGYGSTTELTAVVPSETLAMQPGEYDVFVTNPDLLGARWLVGGTTPGVFTITAAPPPDVVSVTPQRINQPVCTSATMTLTGSDFDASATVWVVKPAGDGCAGGTADPNGNTLCPLTATVNSATEIVANFADCPGAGAWAITVLNPDGQADTFFVVEVRPNNSGHLDPTENFLPVASTLNTARFKNTAEFGFDPFGNTHLYAVGGQGVAGETLDDVEFSQLDIFGNVGPWRVAKQYESALAPRVTNAMTTTRQGASMVRIGRQLIVMGGATEATDTATVVTAIGSVERATILSYDEQPALSLPTVTAGVGLPRGSWFYQVSAVGPWGESLGTREVQAQSASGTIELCWNAPAAAGATSYNIYRSLAADGRANSAVAIAYEVSGSCFTDTGVETHTPAPGSLRGTLSTSAGAGLGEATHRYRVSANIALASTDAFETYAGYSTDVQIAAADVTAGTNAITLNWDVIPNATYSVYKWDGAGYRLLEGAAAVATNTFVDDGAPFDAADKTPRAEVGTLPPGSLSRWTDIVRPMNSARDGGDAVVIELAPPMTSPGVVARILVAGGRTSNEAGAYLTTAESLAINDDGTFGVAWENETPTLNSARAFYSLLTTQGRHETPFPPDPEEPPCGDLDGDGYISCVCGGDDCNDNDGSIHPGATEICGDGIDQDCDSGCGGTDEACSCTTDADSDGHVSAALCGGDDCCDDGSETTVLGCSAATAGGISPGVTEICGNGIDEDCDGVDPVCACADDVDGDGHVSVACGGDDCCDVGTDPSLGCTDATAVGINPAATDICGNGVDEDCDGSEPICFSSAQTADRVSPPTHHTAATRGAAFRASRTPQTSSPQRLYALSGSEPVFVIAVLGADDHADTNNTGRKDFEVCMVDVDGHLAADCGTSATPAAWDVQSGGPPQSSFGNDALLYFDFMYALSGLSSETLTPSVSRSLNGGSFSRFPVTDPATVATGDPGTQTNQLVGSFQSASVSISRAYYKSIRALSYIYLVGGWADSGPTDVVERHLQ